MAERKRLSVTKAGIGDTLNKEVAAYMRAVPGTPAADPTYNLSRLGKHSWRLYQMRENYDAMLSDMGGPNIVSFAQAETARRAAVLGVIATEMETNYVTRNDVEFNIEEYIILLRAQNQLFKTIGMGRKSKPVSTGKGDVTDLDDYLQKRDGKA